ncbi:MAG: hypothetical protein K9N49_05050 [Candidatus Marinimicrobia bacterium]|nr:hypothetical protein [Candidatus Neomarinimicrobiota bacterium]
MKKRTITAALIAFVLGVLVGGGVGVLYTTRLTASTLLLLTTGELHESAQHAWQAYFDESPPVAEWALSNHLAVVHELGEIGYPHDAELRLHELAAHVRLAKLANRREDSEAEASHMAKALEAALKSSAHAFCNLKADEDVMAFVTKLDENRLP